MAGSLDERQKRHLAAVQAILARDSITLTPDNIVNLLAYLQSTKVFQTLAIQSFAGSAAGKPDWGAIDEMVANAELSDKLLERLLSRLSEEEPAHE